jgi:hypothetical protein
MRPTYLSETTQGLYSQLLNVALHSSPAITGIQFSRLRDGGLSASGNPAREGVLVNSAPAMNSLFDTPTFARTLKRYGIPDAIFGA